MAQKSNVISLRNNFFQANIINYNKYILNIYLYFKKYFFKLFWKKNIFLTNILLKITSSKIYLFSNIYFKKIKILKLKKKIKKIKKVKKIKKKNKKLIFKFKKKFYNSFKILNIRFIYLKFLNLNFYLKKIYKNYIFNRILKTYKRYGLKLFPRRFFFYIDAIKLTYLFYFNKININFFIKILVEIFKILQKKMHSRFIFFIKELFKIFLLPCFNHKNNLGIKLRLNGKLRGKPRSSTCCIFLGKVPNQSRIKNINYSKMHAFTKYGVFGFKIWVYKKK